ncbi:tripartite tricarboxylate transporter TctB family protein [Natronobiforma cellulositropha]|uniref:tripartite tricarboxylate transporter TctB family protein n=1 Tax=Natronobiforma cellulositropha TaxID=1679076 RepID=UPI0021D5EAD6|nr:tripartite tricarboxylate transporter TctB family protein [Natronobiforma cellulositropha]
MYFKKLAYSEQALLIGMMVIAAYMFVTSYDYPENTRMFPQITATVTMVGSGLLLVRHHLPSALQTVVTGSISVGSFDDELEDDAELEDQTVDRPIGNELFTTLLTGLYVLVGLSIGFVWITPLFVAAYLLWFEIKWYLIAFLTALSYVITLVFLHVFNFNIDRGFLL